MDKMTDSRAAEAQAQGGGEVAAFDIDRARTLIEYVVGYARSAELKPLSSDACVALRDLHAILHAAPPSAPGCGACADGCKDRGSCRVRDESPPSAPVGVVPGVMACAKCKFRLVRTTFHAANGAISAGENKTEPCPNGCGPLWPVTWEQEARECWERLEALAQQPAAEYADADALIAHLDSLCDEGDEKWQPAQAAIAGIMSWQTTGSPVAAPVQQPAAVDGATGEKLRKLAAEIFAEWDEGNDPRVGKLLKALAEPEFAKTYRADIAELHAALAASKAEAAGGDAVQMLRDLWQLVQEARTIYSGQHASGTFRTVANRIEKIQAALAAQPRGSDNG